MRWRGNGRVHEFEGVREVLEEMIGKESTGKWLQKELKFILKERKRKKKKRQLQRKERRTDLGKGR